MTGSEFAVMVIPAVVALGGGGWKIGSGLVALSGTVDKMGIELKVMHNRIEELEDTINLIAPRAVQVRKNSTP